MEFVFDNVGCQNFDFVFDYLVKFGILNSETLKLYDNGATLANLFISTVVPFVLCYLQVIETILAQVSWLNDIYIVFGLYFFKLNDSRGEEDY